MARVFTREHLLNVSVNLVPMAIVLFFVVAFLVVAPWGYGPLATGLLVVLHAVPFVLLGILTYVAARLIEVEPEVAEEEPELELGEESGAHAGESDGPE